MFHGYASEVWHWLEFAAWKKAHNIEPTHSCEAHNYHSYVEPCPWCHGLPTAYKRKAGVGRRPQPPSIEHAMAHAMAHEKDENS